MATPKAIKAKRWDILAEAVIGAYRVQDARDKGLPENHMMRPVIIGTRLGLQAVAKFQQAGKIDLLEWLQQFECPNCRRAACDLEEKQLNLVQMIERWTCPACGWQSREIPRELRR